MPYIVFVFFNDTATTEIYTLSLHDALPIFAHGLELAGNRIGITDRDHGHPRPVAGHRIERLALQQVDGRLAPPCGERSEEHTSELQSRQYLVCRLLLEKKKNKTISMRTAI